MPVVSPREALHFFRTLARTARSVERGAAAGVAVARAVERLGAGCEPSDVAGALGQELRRARAKGSRRPEAEEDGEPEPIEVEVVSARKVE